MIDLISRSGHPEIDSNKAYVRTTEIRCQQKEVQQMVYTTNSELVV